MRKKKREIIIHIRGYHLASFTVEAAFVVPMVVLVITLALHIGLELQLETVNEAKKTPTVEYLEPVDEMYRKGTNT